MLLVGLAMLGRSADEGLVKNSTLVLDFQVGG